MKVLGRRTDFLTDVGQRANLAFESGGPEVVIIQCGSL